MLADKVQVIYCICTGLVVPPGTSLATYPFLICFRVIIKITTTAFSAKILRITTFRAFKFLSQARSLRSTFFLTIYWHCFTLFCHTFSRFRFSFWQFIEQQFSVDYRCQNGGCLSRPLACTFLIILGVGAIALKGVVILLGVVLSEDPGISDGEAQLLEGISIWVSASFVAWCCQTWQMLKAKMIEHNNPCIVE